ncbi:MAG: arylamine N-acetyltransferase [bacterium]|nr:arylamine N-acetyltransferase [bacterium]
MNEFIFDTEAYLKRVGLTSEPENDVEGLHRLQHAQFFSIPFENFEIQLGREIPLDNESLFRMMVHRKRGGYCFQLNGLMGLALQRFGFNSRHLLARVHLSGPPSSRTHLINCVEIDGRNWIVDVGFGAGGLRAPILLEEGTYTLEEGYDFAMEYREPWGWMMKTFDNGAWKDSYSFDMTIVTPRDIELGNFYTSHAPKSQFVTRRIASLPTERGRISLRNFIFTQVIDGVSTTSEIGEGREYMDVLSNRFGIETGAYYPDLKKIEPAT